jgi:hypothetical protein
MRRHLSKRFEAVASIAVVALFAAVAMLVNGGNTSWIGHRDLNNMTDVETIREHPTLYAKNVWKGKSAWLPMAFAADGNLPLTELVDQMYERMFPQSSRTALREGPHSADELPHWVHVVARHHGGPAPTGAVYKGKTYRSVKQAQDAWDADGTVFLNVTGHNLRVNAGINWQYNQMAGTTAAACTYIALTNTAITPAATDTSLSGEISTNGLARALATATHTSNATSYTLAYTFTASGTQAAQAAAILNASSSGTMCFENTFTQASLVANDTLTVTWTITF